MLIFQLKFSRSSEDDQNTRVSEPVSTLRHTIPTPLIPAREMQQIQRAVDQIPQSVLDRIGATREGLVDGLSRVVREIRTANHNIDSEYRIPSNQPLQIALGIARSFSDGQPFSVERPERMGQEVLIFPALTHFVEGLGQNGRYQEGLVALNSNSGNRYIVGERWEAQLHYDSDYLGGANEANVVRLINRLKEVRQTNPQLFTNTLMTLGIGPEGGNVSLRNFDFAMNSLGIVSVPPSVDSIAHQARVPKLNDLGISAEQLSQGLARLDNALSELGEDEGDRADLLSFIVGGINNPRRNGSIELVGGNHEQVVEQMRLTLGHFGLTLSEVEDDPGFFRITPLNIDDQMFGTPR